MPLKIVYISVMSSYSHSSPVYGQLRAFTELNYASPVQWLHIETSNNESFDQTIKEIINFSPDLIISTAYLFNINSIISLTHRISLLLPNATIVLGGPEFLGGNESFLRQNSFISAIFRSDESPLPQFLRCLDSGIKDWSSIKGICYLDKKHSKYVDNETAAVNPNLDELPSPYQKGYFSTNKPFIHFETCRGCPSHCSFCSSANSKLKQHGIERVKSDLQIVTKTGIKEIRILDRTFNVPEERAVSLLNLFITHFHDIKFHLEIDPSKLSSNFIEKLRTAPKDMFHLEAGVQTFSVRVLKTIKRTADVEKASSNLCKLCRMDNIRMHTDLIAGLPLQKFLNVIEDIKILTKLDPAEIQLETLKLLPGSQLREKEFFDAKYSQLPPYEVLETPDMSFSELFKLKVISRIIDIYYNTENLKVLFAFALQTDNNFLENFAELNANALTRKEKPSLTSRLSMFYQYTSRSENMPLYEMTLFVSFILGIIPRKYTDLKTLKQNEIEQLNRKIVWANNKTELSYNHAFMCKFDSDPLIFFMHKKTPPSHNSQFYIFYFSTLSFSKSISHIEEII